VYYWKNLPAPENPVQGINCGFAAIQLLTKSSGFAHGGTRWTIVTDLAGDISNMFAGNEKKTRP